LPNSGKPSEGGVISSIGTLTGRKVRVTKVTVEIGNIRLSECMALKSSDSGMPKNDSN
jgi:hypothetical protein